MQIHATPELKVSDEQEPEPQSAVDKLGGIIHETDSATIYDTNQNGITKPLVYKCFHKPLSAAAKARFDEICTTAKALDHHNLTAVFEYGTADDGNSYIISEKAEGIQLSAVLTARGALNAVTTASVFSQILDAIDYAHHANVQIGDLSPDRIFVTGLDTDTPVVKITSVGITRNAFEQDASAKSLVGDITAALYASPERCLGKPTDQRSIIYSVGCMLYEVVFGKRVFEGSDPIKLLFDHVNTTITLPANPRSGFSRYWNVLNNCLAANPDHRFKDIAKFRHHIENLEEPIKNERDATFFQQVAMRMSGARTPLGAEVFVLATITLLLFCTTAAISRHMRQCDKLERKVQSLMSEPASSRSPAEMVKEWKDVQLRGAQLGQPPGFLADCDIQIGSWETDNPAEAFAHYKNAAKIYRRWHMGHEEMAALTEAMWLYFIPYDGFDNNAGSLETASIAHYDQLLPLMERQIELGKRMDQRAEMLSYYTNLTDLLAYKSNYQTAKQVLEQAMAAYPDSQDEYHWMRMGDLEARLNNPQRAIAWYQKVLASLKTGPCDPNQVQRVENLIKQLAFQKQPA